MRSRGSPKRIHSFLIPAAEPMAQIEGLRFEQEARLSRPSRSSSYLLEPSRSRAGARTKGHPLRGVPSSALQLRNALLRSALLVSACRPFQVGELGTSY